MHDEAVVVGRALARPFAAVRSSCHTKIKYRFGQVVVMLWFQNTLATRSSHLIGPTNIPVEELLIVPSMVK